MSELALSVSVLSVWGLGICLGFALNRRGGRMDGFRAGRQLERLKWLEDWSVPGHPYANACHGSSTPLPPPAETLEETL